MNRTLSTKRWLGSTYHRSIQFFSQRALHELRIGRCDPAHISESFYVERWTSTAAQLTTPFQGAFPEFQHTITIEGLNP